jgi:phage portal protein BeeE
MDTASLYKANNDAVGGGWMSPNEARFRANLPEVTGGESPMIQQQNYSLAALAKRDAQEDPFGTSKPPAAELPEGNKPEELPEGDQSSEDTQSDEVKRLLIYARATRRLVA